MQQLMQKHQAMSLFFLPGGLTEPPDKAILQLGKAQVRSGEVSKDQTLLVPLIVDAENLQARLISTDPNKESAIT